MKTQPQTLDTFIRRTRKLARELQALMKLYPEDHMEPDQRIFNRLLTNDWRYLSGGYHGPFELRYWQVVEWIADLNSYDSDLRDFCTYELNEPAKLGELTMHPLLPLSAAQSLRQLELQSKVLDRWNVKDISSPTVDRLTKIRRNLQPLVDQCGPKRVAADLRINTDTLRDLLAGNTKPQEKTLDRIERHLKMRKSSDKTMLD